MGERATIGSNADLAPDMQIIPGVRYGRPDQLLSPAYWALRCEAGESTNHNFISRSSSLPEEVGFCLLGGFGVTLEVGEAFYERLRTAGVFISNNQFEEAEILNLLNAPAQVAGRPHRYRFPRQRARRIHRAMDRLNGLDLDLKNATRFRDQIGLLEGVGPKTASWIARNWLGAETVAILDIHILRAGWTINLFEQTCRLPKDYEHLERRFLDFADALQVRASVLDAVIWTDMRYFGSRLVREMSE